MQIPDYKLACIAAIVRHSKASPYCLALEWFAELGFLCIYSLL